MSYVIFVNADTTSSIYTLFNNFAGLNKSEITEEREISITNLETELTQVANNTDIVYILHEDYTTGMSTAQLTDLDEYLGDLFASATDNVDIFYLTNFMDNCMNRTPVATKPSVANQPSITNYSFEFSTAPNGLGCVASTKAKWLQIINLAKQQDEKYLSARITSLVIEEDLVAATSQPLFVFPDISKQTESIDSLYTQYCRIEKNFGRAVPNTENLSFFWFVLGVTIIVIVAWLLSYYSPRNQLKLMKKY